MNHIDEWPDFIATTSFHIFYKIGHEIEVIKNMIKPKPSFYGITWNEKNIFISYRNQIYQFNKNFKFVKTLRYKSHIPGIHQISYYDSHIFVTNTAENYIDKINLDTEAFERYDWLKNHNGTDIEHINSIFQYQGNYYICCLNPHRPSYITKFSNEFKIIEKFKNLGVFNHNIYIENDRLYSLSSNTCQVVSFDIKEPQKKTYINIGRNILPDGFLRGLARSKKHYIIGLTHRGSERNRRDDNTSYLMLTDLKFNILSYVELPLRAQIKDIRIINEIDYAHNNIVCPLESE